MFWDWVRENQVLSGSGVILLGGLGVIIKKFIFGKDLIKPLGIDKLETRRSKADFKVLFIDDQVFKVVDILKQQGWQNTKRIKDVKTFDEIDVREANVFFVDIQGVGKQMQFKDEGLGLAIALKEKFSNKKVVIYSSENKGDRFHKALKIADDYLSKNADPYEFQQIIQNFYDKQK
jgi:CheY-like chemotaxis protein